VGCPDAVRAELLKLKGMLAVAYHADEDYFSVRFESVLVNLETIFATVFTAGKQMGREYFPEVILTS
jgi:hypothetical protein